MSHTPWTQEQAEKWAIDFCKSSRPLEWSVEEKQAFLAGLQKAAEIIEASPTLYGDTVYTSWGEFESHEDTHSAKLVGVRPIEEEK